MTENEVEQEIQAKGLTAPRLTPADIDAQIVAAEYWNPPAAPQVTVCALHLHSGFVVIGNSSPISASNFDAELGRKIAHDDARNQIWALEGYRIKSSLLVNNQRT